MHCRIVGGIKDDLREPIAVTQIDKNQGTMVAAAMHPTGQGNAL
jgi:hypothetical protein